MFFCGIPIYFSADSTTGTCGKAHAACPVHAMACPHGGPGGPHPMMPPPHFRGKHGPGGPGGKAPCCAEHGGKKMECCEKHAAGKKMECCEEHAKGEKAECCAEGEGAHEGHEKPAGDAPKKK